MTITQSDGTFSASAPPPDIAYGPVPSRRLGRSMGINNIPPKVCSYSCTYCQAGATLKKQINRQTFYDPQQLFTSVAAKVEQVVKAGEPIDYLAFVPNGEPTLDLNLGREIDLLHSLNIKIALITNASLLWQKETGKDLGKADWVSLKLDSVSDAAWRRVNRPHPKLQLPLVLEGILEFCSDYQGELVAETMLVEGINDDESSAVQVAEFLGRMRPSKVYLSVPTRPPLDPRVRIPSAEAINRTYQILTGTLDHVELLTDYEGNSFTQTGDVQTDLLAVTAVHPMREEAVRKFLAASKTDWAVVDRLVRKGLLVETIYAGQRFYVRGRGKAGSPETAE